MYIHKHTYIHTYIHIGSQYLRTCIHTYIHTYILIIFQPMQADTSEYIDIHLHAQPHTFIHTLLFRHSIKMLVTHN